MFHSNKKTIVFAVMLFAALSCEQMGELTPSDLEMREALPIVLHPSIKPMSKASIDNSFDLDDTVGVIITKNDGNVYADNERFVYDGTSLQPLNSLVWYNDNSKCRVVAYYPYKADCSSHSGYCYDAAIDQSWYDAFARSDLLAGQSFDVSPGKDAVGITFEHLCTQFQVNVTNLSGESIQSVKFLNLEYHQSIFGTGAFAGDGVPPADIIPYHTVSNGVDIYKAIVPSVQEAVFQVEITTASGARLYKSSDAFSFESGTIYVVDISLEKKESSESLSLIPSFSDWKTAVLNVYDEGYVTPGGEGGNPYFSSYEEMYQAASGWTYSSSTPMGNHYAGAHVTTAGDRDWLSNPSNEPYLLSSAPGYTWKEYNVTLYPFGSPKPADVNQHGIGDCSACAVFAEMAYVAPGFIKSIITDNGNKTYSVKMFDPQGKPVTVCVSSKFLGSSSIGAVSGKNNVACWSTVLEKAMMKWEYIYQVNPDIYGIGSEHVAPLFTGEGDSFAFYPGNLNSSQLKDAVNLSFKSKCLIIGGFTQSGAYVGTSQTVSGHAYSFHKDTDSQALFAMRNPWGYSPGDSGYTDGLLHIKNDANITSLIDIRVICPGKLADYYESGLEPYSPPVFSSSVSYQQFLQNERENN